MGLTLVSDLQAPVDPDCADWKAWMEIGLQDGGPCEILMSTLDTTQTTGCPPFLWDSSFRSHGDGVCGAVTDSLV